MGLCVADWRDAKQHTGWDGSVGELPTLAVELDFEAEVSAAELVRRFIGLRDNRMGFVFRIWFTVAVLGLTQSRRNSRLAVRLWCMATAMGVMRCRERKVAASGAAVVALIAPIAAVTEAANGEVGDSSSHVEDGTAGREDSFYNLERAVSGWYSDVVVEIPRSVPLRDP
ncbi:hypothetical protein F0562_015137 [Nyssa sinensis]|uniref:Uncharacterized protein n=1 Tax=Nyssa sinensis TaxID=561372 RepID=A0A5J4ZG66_9ASTE|nr:hypothetical protein F0562_015137 [Nyssa sinensis]